MQKITQFEITHPLIVNFINTNVCTCTLHISIESKNALIGQDRTFHIARWPSRCGLMNTLSHLSQQAALLTMASIIGSTLIPMTQDDESQLCPQGLIMHRNTNKDLPLKELRRSTANPFCLLHTRM